MLFVPNHIISENSFLTKGPDRNRPWAEAVSLSLLYPQCWDLVEETSKYHSSQLGFGTYWETDVRVIQIKKKKSALSLINLGWKTRLECTATVGFVMLVPQLGWQSLDTAGPFLEPHLEKWPKCRSPASRPAPRKGKGEERLELCMLRSFSQTHYPINCFSHREQGNEDTLSPYPKPGTQQVLSECLQNFFFLMAEIQASTYCLAKTIEGTLHTHLLHYKPVSRH